MAKPIIDVATLSRLRTDLRSAQTGNILDRIIAVEAAIALLIDALEAAK